MVLSVPQAPWDDTPPTLQGIGELARKIHSGSANGPHLLLLPFPLVHSHLKKLFLSH